MLLYDKLNRAQSFAPLTPGYPAKDLNQTRYTASLTNIFGKGLSTYITLSVPRVITINFLLTVFLHH